MANNLYVEGPRPKAIEAGGREIVLRRGEGFEDVEEADAKVGQEKG